MQQHVLDIYMKMLDKAKDVVHSYRDDVIIWDLQYLAWFEPEKFYWVISDTGSHIALHYPEGIELMRYVWKNYSYKASTQYYAYDRHTGLRTFESEHFIAMLQEQQRKNPLPLRNAPKEDVEIHELAALNPPLAKAWRKLTVIANDKEDHRFWINDDELPRTERYLRILQPTTFWLIWAPPLFRAYVPHHPFTMMSALDHASAPRAKAFIYTNERLHEVSQQEMQTLIASKLDPTLFAPTTKRKAELLPAFYTIANIEKKIGQTVSHQRLKHLGL